MGKERTEKVKSEEWKTNKLTTTKTVNKNELKDVLCGASQVKHGTLIQAATRHLRRSQKTSSMAQESKHFKEEETERLCQWIEEQQLWYRTLDLTQFISSGAEQKVYLKGEKGVIKLNDSIYYKFVVRLLL